MKDMLYIQQESRRINTLFPPGLENLEGIFQSGKRQGILLKILG